MRAFLLLFLVGCGMSEERFLGEGIPEWCDAAADCVGFEPEACVDYLRAVDRKACDYDPGAARSCVRHLDEGTCEDLGDLGTTHFAGPEDCDRVWDGCGPLFEPPIDEGTSPDPVTAE